MITRSSHRDSARKPSGVPQFALLLSLLNIPHAAIGLGSGEAKRGKKANSRLDGRFFSVSHGDPELWHANSPCSAHTESRCMLGAPRVPNAPQDKPKNRPHHLRFCSHRWVLSSTGGSDFPPAVAQRALSLIPGFFSFTYHCLLFFSFFWRTST